MARMRAGDALIDDAYKRADLEAFTGRYPRPEVLRYINQGGAELWDILVDAMGKTWARSDTPWSITTTVDTTVYTYGFPSDFLELLSVRISGTEGTMLSRLATPEEALLRAAEWDGHPLYYDLIPGGIQLLPEHYAGLTIIVEYAKTFTDLTDAEGSVFDGVCGWEEYMVCYAAREMALKEGELDFAREMRDEMAELGRRIKKRAPRRDAHRARRVRDVRGERLVGGRWLR